MKIGNENVTWEAAKYVEIEIRIVTKVAANDLTFVPGNAIAMAGTEVEDREAELAGTWCSTCGCLTVLGME